MNTFISNHEVRNKYKEDWLLYFLGSKYAGKDRKRLEYNVRIIATILYSYVFSKKYDDAILILAKGFGSTSTCKKQHSCYLNLIAQRTIVEYFQIESSSK